MTPTCVMQAAKVYGVKPATIERIERSTDSGIGPMHIPSAWLPILDRVGFPQARIRHDRCTNVEAGAWVLAFERWRAALNRPAPHVRSKPALPATVTVAARSAAVTTACITDAANFYRLPVDLFAAVLRTEGGQVGQIHRNTNGSYDMGPAQINSTWLPVLAKAGITRTMVLNNACLNVSIGAWILAQAMQGANPHEPAQWWQHVGDYNSHTPRFNRRYARLVWHNVVKERR